MSCPPPRDLGHGGKPVHFGLGGGGRSGTLVPFGVYLSMPSLDVVLNPLGDPGASTPPTCAVSSVTASQDMPDAADEPFPRDS